MRSSGSEPYLWVHLAGVAAVPIFLELCLVGLAASQAVLPAGLVFLLVAIVGISPILWMQWSRPFNIFSLVVLALKPSELTERQRQILQRFKAPVAKFVAVAVAILACLILWQLNQWLPFHAPILKVSGGWLGGLLLAATAFLLSNLFLQVPASVLTVLLTPERQITAASPYPVAQIPTDFTLIGLQVKRILPPLVPLVPLAAPVTSTSTPPAVGAPVSAPVSAPGSEAMPEVTQPEAQPKITEPKITEPIETKVADSDFTFETAPSQPSFAVVEEEIEETESYQQKLSTLEASPRVERQPQVTDTVVTIKLLPVAGADPASVKRIENESSEGEEFEPVVPSLPTVTDTIVTVGLPNTAQPHSD